MNPQPAEDPQDKIIQLGNGIGKRADVPKVRQRFSVREFINRAGSKSWGVDGYKRDGSRVRETFAEIAAAQCRQLELETEYLRGQAETTVQATKLSAEQIQLAEVALIKLGDDWQRILDAVDDWIRRGKHQAITESVRVDEALEKFNAWIDGTNGNGNGACTLREHTRKGLRLRVNACCNSISNYRVNDIAPDTVDGFLGKLKTSATTRDNYRRAISRFFSWCIERPRRWTLVNPCREVRVDKGEKAPPVILTVEQCAAMLKKAQQERIGAYVALCLFGGLRPFEAGRLTWEQINLNDGEIRLEANQTTKAGCPVRTPGSFTRSCQ